MNESTRTLTYVGVAAVSILLAAVLGPSTPKPPSEFSEIGAAFYPDFAAGDATSLTVVSFDETAKAKRFNVELKDGKWVIGSHRDYPADGKDRLAKTAASVIGIKKEQFATKDPEQYADLQVVDPLDSDAQKIKGRGQRIILKGAGGKVLADYIIGKKVPERDSYYYIRSPEEKSVYMAKLNIDLSTKFADWIESDLLKLQGENLNEIVINKYSIDKQKGRLVGQETNVLKRPKPADPWTLEGLKADTEEVNQDEVRSMTTALSDLKILGVRQKPEGLSADLKTEKGIALDQEALLSLRSAGFYATPNGELLSNEGEILPITDGGVAYTLRFGEVFIGSELEMETGLEAEKRKQDEKDGKKEEEKGSNKSRYVFITAHFHPEGLGPKPTPPDEAAEPAKTDVPAAKPAETKDDGKAPADEGKPAAENPAKEESKEEKPASDQPVTEEPKSDKTTEEKAPEEKAEPKSEPDPKSGGTLLEGEEKAAPAAEAKADDKKPAAAPDAKQNAAPAAPKGPTPEEAAKAKALEAKKKYETDLKAYQDKVTKGEAKVKELNERFADWYYVISEENFLKLRLSRKSLVKEKTKPEAKPGEAKAGEAKPGDAQPEATTPDESKPEEAKPEAAQPDEKKDEAAPPAEPKAEEMQPEEKKAEETKAEEKPAEPKPEAPKAEEKKPE